VGGTLERFARERRPGLRRRAQPEWTQPMLATLTGERFSDSDWIFERKLDGVRCLVFRRRGRVSLMSRNRKALDNHYPELVEAISGQRTDPFIADGEIVAFDRGQTSFARLQGRMQLTDPDAARRTGIAVFLYLFDLLHVGRFDVTGLELRDRKRVLRETLRFTGPLRLTSHRNAEGEAYYREACRRGWEGVIAKRASGTYVHGRSPEWLKFKCVNQQEMVVVGFTDPHGRRRRLGALLVGYYQGGKLRYAGKVGTGFDDATLDRLGDRLDRLERDSSPLDGERPRERGVHWVRPELVAEIGFTEWTRDGRLRHPRYLGLRTDKPAREVVRE
jgi:bifunctional non-homologous end joining protein LigD